MTNPLDRFRLDGRVAIVTGASRGIGAGIAVTLAQCGADVIIAARNADTLAGVVKEVEAAGRRAVPVTCDLSDLERMQDLVDAATGELGRLDIVVNNVGGTMPQPLMDTTTSAFEEAFHFNVATAFDLIKRAAPVMLAGDGGSIVNITSTMGRVVERGYVAYGTAKAALAHMTRLAARDLAPRVRVNALAPGAIVTDALGMVLNDELETLMVEGTPMRRLGQVEDIALGVLYLVSDAASYVTGKVLDVDGGLEAANLSMGLPDL